MYKLRLPFVLQSLVFLIPINYYVIGSGKEYGVQWALFQYENNVFGDNFYSVTVALINLISGNLQGPRAVSSLLWITGAMLLLGGFVIYLLKLQEERSDYVKYTAILTLVSAILFLISNIAYYGIMFHGPNGLCIPFGIPVILVIAGLMYRYRDTGEVFLPVRMRDAKAGIIGELILVVFVAVFVKIIVFSLSMFPALVWLHPDITLYQNYLDSALSGRIPYIDYVVEYPQLFFIPVFLAAIPSLILQSPSLFFHSFLVLMHLIDIATLLCVYFIARRLFGENKAFLCSLLYATAFSSTFLLSLTYDSFPTFLLMFSILLFLYGKEVSAYASAAVGTAAKWFPACSIPFFILYTIKKRREMGSVKRGLFLSVLILCLSILPFVVLNYQVFLKTYLFHLDRGAYATSLIYYLDVISQYFTSYQPFVTLSLVLLVIAEVLLMCWYYRCLDGKESTLCYVIFLSVFCFILLNKVFASYYLIWITPFLALFFSNSLRHIILFYLLQGITYLEIPVFMERVTQSYSFSGLASFSLTVDSFEFYTLKFVIYLVVLVVAVRQVWEMQGRGNEGNSAG